MMMDEPSKYSLLDVLEPGGVGVGSSSPVDPAGPVTVRLSRARPGSCRPGHSREPPRYRPRVAAATEKEIDRKLLLSELVLLRRRLVQV